MLMKSTWLTLVTLLVSIAAAAKYPICTNLPKGITIQLAEEVQGPASIDLSDMSTEGNVEVAIFRNSKRSNGLVITDEINAKGYCSQDIRRIIQEEGWYVVLFANCDSRRYVRMCGRVAFRSKYGYLPAWLSEIAWCAYLTTACYLGALTLTIYRYRLPLAGKKLLIEHIILAVLLLGSSQMIIFSARYFIYNRNGIIQKPFMVFADLLGCMKTGAGRALLLLAAFGGGLVRDFIVPNNCIACLCTVYTLLLIASVTLQYLLPLDDFSLAFNILCGILDAYFILWSLLAVTRVIRSLETSDAARAKRFVHLRRWIILLSVAGLVPLQRLFLVDGYAFKAGYIISAVKRAVFLIMVLLLQWFVAAIPAQRRSRVRVELPNIIPAFNSKTDRRRRHGNVGTNGTLSASNAWDLYGDDGDDKEGLIRPVATFDDDSSIGG